MELFKVPLSTFWIAFILFRYALTNPDESWLFLSRCMYNLQLQSVVTSVSRASPNMGEFLLGLLLYNTDSVTVWAQGNSGDGC